MRHIEVATEDHRLFLLELLEITEEVAIPALPVSEPGEVAFGIRHLDVHSDVQPYGVFPSSERKRTRSRNSARVSVSVSPAGITEPLCFFSLIASRRRRTSLFWRTSRRTSSRSVSRT